LPCRPACGSCTGGVLKPLMPKGVESHLAEGLDEG
jgi:hypothetical protein